MKCKNCGHNIRKHIKVGKSFYCIDDHKDYGGKLVCACKKPEPKEVKEK